MDGRACPFVLLKEGIREKGCRYLEVKPNSSFII